MGFGPSLRRRPGPGVSQVDEPSRFRLQYATLRLPLNPAASAFPAACRGVSERMVFKIPSLGIEDSPELAPESFISPYPRFSGPSA